MRSKKTNKQVRQTLKSTKALHGIQLLQLPASIGMQPNKKWIDSWMHQNESIRSIKASEIAFSKTPGLIMKWWEN